MWPREDEFIQQWKLQKANEKFERSNNLRLDRVPQALQRAYSRMGIQFYGEKSVRGWQISETELKQMWPPYLPALILRGEHDFVTMDHVAPYVEGIALAQYAELSGLSHMAHLEDETRSLLYSQRYFTILLIIFYNVVNYILLYSHIWRT